MRIYKNIDTKHNVFTSLSYTLWVYKQQIKSRTSDQEREEEEEEYTDQQTKELINVWKKSLKHNNKYLSSRPTVDLTWHVSITYNTRYRNSTKGIHPLTIHSRV